MQVEINEFAVATMATLLPFMPFLLEVGKAGSQKFVETLSEKGGEAAWNKARAMWRKLQDYFGEDPEFQSAATLLSTHPEDEIRQSLFAQLLVSRLEQTPKAVDELLELLGGDQAIQQVIADNHSWIEDVSQRIKGAGTQTIEIKDRSVGKNIRQQINSDE